MDIIKSLNGKTCELDMLPSKFIKENLNEFANIIANIVNITLQHRVFVENGNS